MYNESKIFPSRLVLSASNSVYWAKKKFKTISREEHDFQQKPFSLLHKWWKNDNLYKFLAFKTELEALNTSRDGKIFDLLYICS